MEPNSEAGPQDRVMRRASIAVCLFAATWLSVAASASAFELERVGGNPCDAASHFVYWPPRGTEYSVESLDATRGPLARDEANAWTSATPFSLFERAQQAPCDTSDGVVSTSFSDKLCDGTSFASGVLAITSYTFDRTSGVMLTAEIVFNSNAAVLADEATFRHVSLHEFGHVIGLAHSDACGGSGDNSVMKAVLHSTDPRFRTPGTDDIAGVDSIYGTATPTPTPTATPVATMTRTATPTPNPLTPRPPSGSSGGCSLTAGDHGTPSGAPLLLVVAALLARRRQRAGHPS